MYTKLFSSITDSTIWREEDHVRLVWITMLAMADKSGHVMASVPGLADRARVSLDNTVKALAKLMSPDQWSRSAEFSGRRIEEIGGGWELLNYRKYRSIRDEEERKDYMRNYMRKRRSKQPVNNVSNVNSSKPPLAQAEFRKPPLAQAEAEAEAEAVSQNQVLVNPPTPLNSNSAGSEHREDLEIAVHEIAALYPKIRDPQNVSQEIQFAIAAAVARDGRDLVWAGTKSMAEAVAKWSKDKKQFIPAAGRFFRESQYRTDPGEWTRSESNGKRNTNRVQEQLDARTAARRAVGLDH